MFYKWANRLQGSFHSPTRDWSHPDCAVMLQALAGSPDARASVVPLVRGTFTKSPEGAAGQIAAQYRHYRIISDLAGRDPGEPLAWTFHQHTGVRVASMQRPDEWPASLEWHRRCFRTLSEMMVLVGAPELAAFHMDDIERLLPVPHELAVLAANGEVGLEDLALELKRVGYNPAIGLFNAQNRHAAPVVSEYREAFFDRALNATVYPAVREFFGDHVRLSAYGVEAPLDGSLGALSVSAYQRGRPSDAASVIQRIKDAGERLGSFWVRHWDDPGSELTQAETIDAANEAAELGADIIGWGENRDDDWWDLLRAVYGHGGG